MTTDAYEASSNSLRGLARSIGERGLTERVAAQISPVAQQALREPTHQRWWPSSAYDAISLSAIELTSEQDYEEMCLQSARKTFGPFVAPMVKVTLNVVGVTPAGLFGQLAMLTLVAIRGPQFKYVAESKNAGTLTITYLAPTDARVALLSWKATIRYIFEMTIAGTIHSAVAQNNNQTFVFRVGW